MKQKIAITLGLVGLLTSLMIFFNAKIVGYSSNVLLRIRPVQVCGKTFDAFEVKTNLSGVQLARESLKIEGLTLPVLAPVNLIIEDPNLQLSVGIEGENVNPILPDLPILPVNASDKLCQFVGQYAQNFSSKKFEIVQKFNSQVFSASAKAANVQIGLKSGYQAAISNSALKIKTKHQSLKTVVESVNKSINSISRTIPLHDFVIIYENGYQNDVQDLVDFYNSRNIRTQAIELSQLPGYNSSAPTPTECQGEFLKECYHFWGDPVPGISQLAVPSLPGYVKTSTAFTQYAKVSFVPGLIRAFIRMKKKQNPLWGALLIGSPEKIPPYNSSITQHYYDGYPWLTSGETLPLMKVFTDVYYSVSDVPLVENSSSLAQQIRTPNIWSCSGPSGVRMDYWCNNNEWRFWPNPPLTAYRNPAHIPDGKIYNLKYGYMHPFWGTFNYKDVVPVGRIVTPGKWINGREVVANYVQKLIRWYSELPAMTNTSIASHGGSTNDHWIYSKEDIDQFLTTFGPSSKVYASEFFVSSSKCNGRCLYETPSFIMDKIGEKNMVAMHLNGHGGHIAIQGPYGNGNISSTYLTEKSVHLDDGLRLKQFLFPNDTTLKQIENHGKLVGVVFANSCSPSDYLVKNQFDYLARQIYPDTTVRSWAEEWIGMNDAGAMNTFLNGNVGWGGSDNDYNVAYMKRLKTAWQSCGNIGDAHRLLILDGLRDGYMAQIGNWQLHNRHLLGSPINPIARLPRACSIIVRDAQTVEQNVRGQL